MNKIISSSNADYYAFTTLPEVILEMSKDIFLKGFGVVRLFELFWVL